MTVSCTNHTPAWFVGHWRDWHRGHSCNLDDGKPRSVPATTEVAQHLANRATGFLTDAELRMLRAATSSGNETLVRALDELAARRANGAKSLLADDEIVQLRATLSRSDLLTTKALDELTTRRAAARNNDEEQAPAGRSPREAVDPC